MEEIKTLSSREVYRNKWMRLREDEIERAEGGKGIYSVVEKPDFAVIIPLEDGYVHLVEQYRYPVKGRYMEFPQGTWDSGTAISPQELARAELQEETGLSASSMIHVGFQYLAHGLCTQGYHIYLATGLTQGERKLDPEEEGLTTFKMAMSEFEDHIMRGDIKDATTCNAWGLAKLHRLI